MKRIAAVLSGFVLLAVGIWIWMSDSGYEWSLDPTLPLPSVPPDNPMSEVKVELGRRLFYDTRLSLNNTMSCASCHIQALAFTDGKPRSVGATGELHPLLRPFQLNRFETGRLIDEGAAAGVAH